MLLTYYYENTMNYVRFYTFNLINAIFTMNWSQALKDYKYYLKIERGLSKNSIENYGYDLKNLVLSTRKFNQ